MPARLTFATVAVPFEFVTALPTLLPRSVKSIVFPEIPPAAPVIVADRSTVPPSVPVTAGTASEVGTTSAKQTWTDWIDGVVALSVVDRKASYLR